MKRIKTTCKLTSLILSVLAMFSCNQQTKQDAVEIQESKSSENPKEQFYTNPIIDKYLADPCIMYDHGYYYLFATGKAEDGRYIPIHRTKDFTQWEFVGGAVDRGSETDWNYKHFWAPEVIKINNLWHLYYTATPKHSPRNSGNRVGLAVSENIAGPYTDKGVVVPHGSIDGHVYIENDTLMYIFYTIEHLNSDGLIAGQIYMDRLLSPEKVAGNPKQIISHHPWQEGPFLQKRFEKYFLTYSCGNWQNETYHLRYAVANVPTGPFTEQPDTILSTNSMVKGPGHHFMYTNDQGKDWIVYHGWDTAHTGRYPRIDRIFFSENKISSDGPTFTKQRLHK